MNLFDQNSNSFVKVVMAKIDSGYSCALPATPLEVRVFDSSHLNGELIGWEYNNGICYLDRPLVAGETAKFYSIDGLPLFDSETFVNNLSSERVKEIEVSFIDSFDVRDFLVEVDDRSGDGQRRGLCSHCHSDFHNPLDADAHALRVCFSKPGAALDCFLHVK